MMYATNIKNRIISVFLTLTILFSSFVSVGFSALAKADTDNIIGSVAKITSNEFVLSKNPRYAKHATDSMDGVKKSDLPARVVIEDYYYDEKTDILWYGLVPAPGYDWPSKYNGYNYIHASDVEIISAAKNYIYNEKGKEIKEHIDLPQYEKIKLCGACSYGSDVEYVWQVLADGMWVSVYGANSEEFIVSAALLHSALDEDGETSIRLVTKKGALVVNGSPITVTVIPYVEKPQELKSYKITVLENETEVTEIVLEHDGRKQLYIRTDAEDYEEIVWQTKKNENWFDIGTSACLELKAEKIKDLLSVKDGYCEGFLRAVLKADGREFPGNEIPVSVLDPAPELEIIEGAITSNASPSGAYSVNSSITPPSANEEAASPGETPEEPQMPPFSIIEIPIDIIDPSEQPKPEEAPDGNSEITEAPTPAPEAPSEPTPDEGSENTGESEGGSEESASLIGELLSLFTTTVHAEEGDEGEPTPQDDVSETATTPSDSGKMYNVVIEYLFEDSSTAANSYTATVGENATLTATVEFPTVVGYEPYISVNGTYEKQDSYVFDSKTFTEDFNLKVYYLPAFVSYTVNVYHQNTGDDNYTLYETTRLKGLTETQIPVDLGLKYEGFTQLLHDQPTIAADGSTQIDVYFDRNYYLMKFALGDNAYGVQPIYARYGVTIEIGSPMRPGYTFNGWDEITEDLPEGDGLLDTLPIFMPSSDTTWRALWTMPETAKVSIVIWGENPNNEGYSYLSEYSKEIYVKPDTEITYQNDKTLICELEEHRHNADCTTTCGMAEHEHTAYTGECYELICGQHAHTLECYKTSNSSSTFYETAKPDKITDSPLINGKIYTYTSTIIIWSTTHYVLYLNGKWYQSSQNSDTTEITKSCTIDSDHIHAGDCYNETCGKEVHHHTSDCYDHSEHTHSDTCYLDIDSKVDSALWEFVKSDTVTVSPDGSTVMNVYFDRTEFTLHFRKANSNTDDYGTITDKWGADIRSEYQAKSNQAGTALWSTNSNGSGPWTCFLDVMPNENRTYYSNSTNTTDTHTATYWGQGIDSDEYDILLYTSTVKYSGTLNVTQEDKVSIEGFSYNSGTANQEKFDGAKFYYDRKRYTLSFNNGYNVEKTENPYYEASLAEYASFKPTLPTEIYEDGSRVFEGWYQNPQCTGEKVDLSKMTMPAKDMILYAKWTLVKHKVEIYTQKTADGTYDGKIGETFEVQHGHKITGQNYIPQAPTNGNYNFAGWFYTDENGKEQAWDFKEMTVNHDITIYAKWDSNKMIPYTIRYVIIDENGKEIEIAEPTTGSALAGTNKTFNAKGGNDLYEDYQEGYFPTTQSHTEHMDINKDEITFTFVYVAKEAVPYTVKYLEKGTNKVLKEEKIVNDNRKAVVTENFEPITGYLPDEFQKMLIINPGDDAANEIIFYYTKDDTHALYTVTHYLQQPDGSWRDAEKPRSGTGEVGATITESPKTYTGYTYDKNIEGSKASGTLEKDKTLELKLYYTRNKYPYKVIYVDADTGKSIDKDTIYTGDNCAYYDTVVTGSAKIIPNYTPETQSGTCTIRVDDENDIKYNIITIKYKENTVPIHFKVVGPDGCGTVTPTDVSVKKVSDTGVSSTANANENYRFIGWFEDEACTKPCTTGSTTFALQKPSDGWVEKTYYAKFEYDLAALTIQKTGAEDIDENQTFIFHIKGIDDKTSSIDLKVVIKGNDKVTVNDLPVGKYEITEETSWSWRYSPKDNKQTKDVTPSGDNTLPFTNQRTEIYWLNGASYKDNKFIGDGKENGEEDK